MKHRKRSPLAIIAIVVAVLAVAPAVLSNIFAQKTGSYDFLEFSEYCLIWAALASIPAGCLGIVALVQIRSDREKLRGTILALLSILLGGMTCLGSGMAIPSFLEVGMRTLTADAKARIRNTAVHLETYAVDHGVYPPAVDEHGDIVIPGEEDNGVSAGYVPWMLTTPVPYVAVLPEDPGFKKPEGEFGPFRYATNGTSCWILVSNGPDRDVDINAADFPDPEKGNCVWRGFVSQYGIGTAIEYDVTNGTKSTGDILRVGP